MYNSLRFYSTALSINSKDSEAKKESRDKILADWKENQIFSGEELQFLEQVSNFNAFVIAYFSR